MADSRPDSVVLYKKQLDGCAKGCGQVIAIALRYLALFLVVAYAIKHNPF